MGGKVWNLYDGPWFHLDGDSFFDIGSGGVRSHACFIALRSLDDHARGSGFDFGDFGGVGFLAGGSGWQRVFPGPEWTITRWSLMARTGCIPYRHVESLLYLLYITEDVVLHCCLASE